MFSESGISKLTGKVNDTGTGLPSFVPGCLVLRWLLPHVSFSNLTKGIFNLIFVLLAVILTDMLLVIWCHIMMNGLQASFYSGLVKANPIPMSSIRMKSSDLEL